MGISQLVLFTLGGFLIGSLPFAVWLGKLFLKKDVRHYGDHNPGATNVFRAGGRMVGVLAVILEIGKGALPATLAYHILGIRGWWLVLILLSPVMGHHLSPFLGFRGGKAVAATLGVWGAVTLGIIPASGGIVTFVLKFFLASDSWIVMVLCFANLVAGYFFGIWKEWELFAGFLLNWLILIWTHRKDLVSLPKIKKSSPTNTDL
ncbi:glycerol-3-phosphate acyltransferase [Thermospira aquatica]|uniref:Glycerol-3-phosphate acyltransferase n=1 Tax=Thermospira aquatica TaxID=2828656 RepID=A0AAX3BFX8_9SPIR|nr:glycerol-3-phosphate acyltransferase [Thermospira aquatica]URA11222.1 glycerol-3-phosphate acyltransferase [Thermospira aquatica]